MKNLFSFLFLLIATFQYTLAQSNDEKHPFLTNKYRIYAGVFLPAKTINIGADGSSPNDEINFEDSFQLNDNEPTLFLKFDWKFAKMWIVSGEYFSVKNAHTLSLEKDIEWEDIVFEKGSSVRGGFGINMFRTFVGRIISTGDKHEFGGGLGAHLMNTNAFIEGHLNISDSDDNEIIKFEKRRVSATIPLPNIGLWYYFAPSKKWLLTARVDWFGISVGEYSGILWNVAPSVNYQIFKNIGIGLDYRFFKLKAKVNKTDWNGNFNMTFQGPLFTINASF